MLLYDVCVVSLSAGRQGHIRMDRRAVREAVRSAEEVGKKDPVAVCCRVVVVARREHVHVFSINRERDDGTTRAHKSA